ncbi:MAG: AAA family ATPase [Thermoplasmata archaeon]
MSERLRGRLVAVEGPSGAGKSRLVRAWGRRIGAPVLAEAFDRLRPRPNLLFDGADALLRLEERLLAEEERRYAEARRRAAAGRTVLLDTGFLGPLTYTAGLSRTDPGAGAVVLELLAHAGRALARGSWGMADLTVFLDVPERQARERARCSPADHPARLRGRHARVGRWERRFWIEVYGRAAPDRLLVLDGRRGLATLVSELERRVPRAAGPSAGHEGEPDDARPTRP